MGQAVRTKNTPAELLLGKLPIAEGITQTDDKFLTVGETADVLNVTHQTVGALLKRGRLPYVMQYGKRLIPTDSVDAYKIARRPNRATSIGSTR